MLKRMLQATACELRLNGWEYVGAAAIIGWGGWLLFAIFAFVSGDGDFLRAAPIVAVCLAAFSGWLLCLVSFSSNFSMALSMGRTRRVYFVSSLTNNFLAAAAAMGLCYPSAWLAWALQGLAGLARADFAAGTEPGLLMYHRYWAVLLASALGAVALGAALGALVMRFGQKGFWVIWFVGVFGGAVMSAVSRIRTGPIGAFVTACRTWANGLSAAGWWGVAGAGVLALLAAAWLLVRRASVK